MSKYQKLYILTLDQLKKLTYLKCIKNNKFQVSKNKLMRSTIFYTKNGKALLRH